MSNVAHTKLAVVGVVLLGLMAVIALSGSVAAQGEVTIGIDDVDDFDEEDTESTKVFAEGIDDVPEDGIGAFHITISADDVDIEDVSTADEDNFSVEWADNGDIAVVGYTNTSDGLEDDGPLVELEISGDETSDATLEVDEVVELVDGDANEIDATEGPAVTFEIEGDDPGPGPGPAPIPDDPTAAFTIEPEEPEEGEEVTFDATDSEPGEDEIVDFSWDIDGEEFEGEVVNTTFDEAGDYDVELTVENDEGRTDTATDTVTVVEEDDAPPRPPVDPEPPEPDDGLDDDGIQERVDVPADVDPVRGEAVDIAVDEETNQTTAVFSEASQARTVVFDDDTLTGEVTAVQYETTSERTGAPSGTTLGVTQFAVPDHSANATLTFAVSTDDLDEAAVSTEQLRIARYDADDGEWETLETGVEEDIEEVLVTANTPRFSWFAVTAADEPAAAIEFDPEDPVAGEEVTFDGGDSEPGDGEIVSYDWDIDGETYDGETVTHTFDESGEYDVELTVENEEGLTDTTTETVTVDDAELYDLTVEVEDQDGNALEGADVTVNGESDTTASDGTVTFELPADEYAIEADADGYEPATEDIDLDSDETVTLTLTEEEELFELGITVTDDEDGDAIEDATVTVNGDEATTGEDGMVSFQLPADEYDIDVESDGYEPATETVDLDEDTTVTIELVEEDDGIGLLAILLILGVLLIAAGVAIYYYTQQQ